MGPLVRAAEGAAKRARSEAERALTWGAAGVEPRESNGERRPSGARSSHHLARLAPLESAPAHRSCRGVIYDPVAEIWAPFPEAESCAIAVRSQDDREDETEVRWWRG